MSSVQSQSFMLPWGSIVPESRKSVSGQQEAVQNGVWKALESIGKANQPFAGVVKLGAPPPLSIKGIGQVNYPLQPGQAAQIVEQAHKAPFGKGSQTLVDETVRRTWEINADQLDISSSQWVRYQAMLAEYVRKAFSIDEQVKVVPYKMLLYGPGAFFKEHKDTVGKIPNMFGSLIMALPSAHEGGEVTLRHGQKKMVYESCRDAATQPSAAFWYADVDHAVLEVKSGYRWVIAFNLAVDRDVPIPVFIAEPDASLVQSLKQWKENMDECSPHLMFPLDYQYTESGLDLRSMKGTDRVLLDKLIVAAKEVGFDISLAMLEQRKMGACEFEHDGRGRYSKWGYDECEDEYDNEGDGGFHTLEEVYEEESKILLLNDVNGNTLAKDLDLDVYLLPEGEEAFGDEPDRENYEGYMGNSGPDATHWYHMSAIVMAPQERSSEILASFKNPEAANVVLGNYVKKAETDASAFQFIKLSSSRIWREFKSYDLGRLQSHVVSGILLSGLRFKDYSFFQTAVENYSQVLHPDHFFCRLRNPELALLEAPDGVFLAIEKLILRHNSFHARYLCVEAMQPRQMPNHKIDMVVKATLGGHAALFNRKEAMRPSQEDGRSLADYIADHGVDVNVAAGQIYAESRACGVASVANLSFALQLRKHIRAGRLAGEQFRAAYRDFATQFVDHLDLRTVSLQDDRHDSTYGSRFYFSDYSRVRLESEGIPLNQGYTFELLVDLGRSLIEDGDKSLAGRFARKVEAQIGETRGTFVFKIWLPFLHRLVAPAGKEDLGSQECYGVLTGSILAALRDRYLGPEPSTTLSLQRGEVDCSCRDCIPLNAFLRDPTLMAAEFPLAHSRRRHVHNKLDSAGIDCTHQTRRTGSPQPLVVTKTATKANQSRTQWEARRVAAQSLLRRMHLAKFALALGGNGAAGSGEAKLEALVLAPFGMVEGPPAGQALRTTAGNLGPGAGTKRKGVEEAGSLAKRIAGEADVVDLTGED